jgi:DNA-directed RNA polymerase subunit RPC12/RpoP
MRRAYIVSVVIGTILLPLSTLGIVALAGLAIGDWAWFLFPILGLVLLLGWLKLLRSIRCPVCTFRLYDHSRRGTGIFATGNPFVVHRACPKCGHDLDLGKIEYDDNNRAIRRLPPERQHHVDVR